MEHILQRSQYLYPTLVEECLDLPVRTIKSEIRFDFFFSKKEGILIEDLAINLLGEQIETDLSLLLACLCNNVFVLNSAGHLNQSHSGQKSFFSFFLSEE